LWKGFVTENDNLWQQLYLALFGAKRVKFERNVRTITCWRDKLIIDAYEGGPAKPSKRKKKSSSKRKTGITDKNRKQSTARERRDKRGM